jgi:hypothetical protein
MKRVCVVLAYIVTQHDNTMLSLVKSLAVKTLNVTGVCSQGRNERAGTSGRRQKDGLLRFLARRERCRGRLGVGLATRMQRKRGAKRSCEEGEFGLLGSGGRVAAALEK